MQHKKMTPKNGTGLLHVLVIGRVSTPNQPLSNIEAGYEYAERGLKDIYDGELLIRRLGKQGSGMLVGRETILEAMELINSGWPDVVVMEDVSKSYRNPRWIYAFVQDCVDLDVRVIAPGDNLDTWDDNWEIALGSAALRHGLHIPETRRRVRRTSTKTFAEGGMVQRVRFGYRKLTKEEANSGQFGPKGLRLARIPELTPIVQELRRKIVVENATGTVLVEWLTQEAMEGQGIPPGPYVKDGRWKVDILLDLLRDPILYGLRQFPKVKYAPRFSDGKHNRSKNPAPQQQHYPELAHMTEEQWNTMNAALDAISGKGAQPGGVRHPRYRVGRKKSLAPLQHATCVVCGEFFYLADDDGIKCQHASKHDPEPCWNHVQASCAIVREKLVDLVLNRWSRHPDALRVMLDAAWDQVQKLQGSTGRTTANLEREIQDLQNQAERLGQAIQMGGKLDTLVTQLKTIEKELQKKKRQREEGVAQVQGSVLPASRAQLQVEPREALLELSRTSFDFADLLRKIFPRFLIQPVQALDSGLVRPRGLLTVDLGALLPAEAGAAGANRPEPENLEIDFFEPPVHIRYLAQVTALKQAKEARGEKVSLGILAAELGINRMTVKRALGYQKLIVAAGLPGPYRLLEAKPAQASRWKPRAKSRPNRGEDGECRQCA